MTLLLLATAVATNAVTEFSPVTVYASRTDAAIDRIPADVQVLSAREIARSGAQNLPELLEKKAGVAVRTLNGNPLQAQIAMRGFGENSFGRVKVIVDGEERNNVDMAAPDLAGVALGAVGRVEVVRGPSPVLHGDGAVAGVVNVMTETPDDGPVTRLAASGGSYGTAGASMLTRTGTGDDGVAYSAAYDYARSDGYRDRSAYEMHSLSAGVRKMFENDSFVALKANYSNRFYEMPGAVSRTLLFSDRRAAAYRHDWCREWGGGLGFESKVFVSDERSIGIDGRYRMRQRRSNWGDYRYANDYVLHGIFFSPRYVDETAVAGFGNTFTAGADLNIDRYAVEDRSGFGSPESWFGRFREALFAEDEFALTDELSLVAGARVEQIDSRWNGARGLSEPKRSERAADFELGVLWWPLEGVKTYAKGTRFHRSPFCDEMNYTESGKMLRPERGSSFDIGADWSFLDGFDLSLNAYALVIDDEIFYNPYVTPADWGWNGYNCNSPARTRRAGFDAAISWLREKTAEFSVRYSAVRAEFAGGSYHGCDVPLVPNHRIRAEAGVWIADDFEIKGGWRYVGAQRLMGDFGNDHGELGGYCLFDIGFIYEPSWAEGWSLSLVVDNLLDREYCDFAGWSDATGAYYYPARARSFLLTVAYEF